MALKGQLETYSIDDLLHWFDVVARNELVIRVEKLESEDLCRTCSLEGLQRTLVSGMASRAIHRYSRERVRRELATLRPVHRSRIDGDLLCADVRIDNLVDGRTTTLTVVVRNRRPPVSLALDVPKDHVLDRLGHTGNLPRNVRLPAPPSLRRARKSSAPCSA